MKHYNTVIIGFGKAGKTLAVKLAKQNQSVLLIEKDPKQFGGSCPNQACVPTKMLEQFSRESLLQKGEFANKAIRYTEAIRYKEAFLPKAQKTNYDKVVNSGVEVLVGTASFVNNREIVVETNEEQLHIGADAFVINTGSEPSLPDIEGIDLPGVYTSKSLMEQETLPHRLVIVGGGYIGLEFACMYDNFGSEVTILTSRELLAKEDVEVQETMNEIFAQKGISVVSDARVNKIEKDEQGLKVYYGEKSFVIGDAVLLATGRKPNTSALHLENTDIQTDAKGYIVVNEKLMTSVDNVYAVGDAIGGLQFTYMSLDDGRIVYNQLVGDKTSTTSHQTNIPFTIFVDPPFSKVGLTENEAKEKGVDYVVKKIDVAGLPVSKVNRKPIGFMKALVDPKSDRILGAVIFAANSHEIINLIKLAMDHDIPSHAFNDMIFNHPTMAEGFNDLFN